MARKPKQQADDPEQSKRFLDTAKEVEAEDEEVLERAFKGIAQKPANKPKGG
jgi:hypothetical protein